MIRLIPSYHERNQDFGEINLYIHKIENERLHKYLLFLSSPSAETREDLVGCPIGLEQGYSIKNPKGPLAKFPFSPGSGRSKSKNITPTKTFELCTKGDVALFVRKQFV